MITGRGWEDNLQADRYAMEGPDRLFSSLYILIEILGSSKCFIEEYLCETIGVKKTFQRNSTIGSSISYRLMGDCSTFTKRSSNCQSAEGI
jgi:hypothetical protein